MGVHIFHGRIAANDATVPDEVAALGQVQAAVAAALATAVQRENHSGTQAAETISDLSDVVSAAIAEVVGAAPASLDTLQELAEALLNDEGALSNLLSALGVVTDRVDALEEVNSRTGHYAQSIGGSGSLFTITHAMASRDVRVEVYDTLTGQSVFPVIARTSPAEVTVDFGSFTPGAEAYRVLVSKVG